MSHNQQNNQSPIATYEAQLAQLEAIVSDMERGELPLEHALAQYEQGIVLIRQCQHALQCAAQKIEILSRDQSGNETLIPFNETDQ